MVLGAACFVAEACGADTEHPPVTENLGTDPVSGAVGSSGATAEGSSGQNGGNGGGGNGAGTTNPNGLLPPDQTSQTNPGAGNGNGTGSGTGTSAGGGTTTSSSGVVTTTPTQPTLDGG